MEKPLCSTYSGWSCALEQCRIRDQNRLYLLMCLRPDFKLLQGHVIHRESLPTLVAVVKELMTKVQGC